MARTRAGGTPIVGLSPPPFAPRGRDEPPPVPERAGAVCVRPARRTARVRPPRGARPPVLADPAPPVGRLHARGRRPPADLALPQRGLRRPPDVVPRPALLHPPAVHP